MEEVIPSWSFGNLLLALALSIGGVIFDLTYSGGLTLLTPFGVLKVDLSLDIVCETCLASFLSWFCMHFGDLVSLHLSIFLRRERPWL